MKACASRAVHSATLIGDDQAGYRVEAGDADHIDLADAPWRRVVEIHGTAS